MSTRYTKEELEEYFFEALAMFNDVLESDIISENVILDFLHLPTDLLYISSFARNIFLTNMKSSTKPKISLRNCINLRFGKLHRSLSEDLAYCVSNSSYIEHLKTIVLNKKAFMGCNFQ